MVCRRIDPRNGGEYDGDVGKSQNVDIKRSLCLVEYGDGTDFKVW